MLLQYINKNRCIFLNLKVMIKSNKNQKIANYFKIERNNEKTYI